MAAKIGHAGAYVLGKENKHAPKILIGMDTRRSGHMLEAALAAGVMSMGGNVVCAGVVPTPAVAYLTRTMGFDAGIVVSASHNSAEFNGIKFFNSEGYKLRDEIETDKRINVYHRFNLFPISVGTVKLSFKSVDEVFRVLHNLLCHSLFLRSFRLGKFRVVFLVNEGLAGNA